MEGSSPSRGCPCWFLTSTALLKSVVGNVSERDFTFLFLPQTGMAFGPALPAARPVSPQDSRLSQTWVRVSLAPGPALLPFLSTLSPAPAPGSGNPTFTQFLCIYWAF